MADKAESAAARAAAESVDRLVDGLLAGLNDKLSGEAYLQADANQRGERLVLALNRLILLLERAKFAEYVELMQYKRTLFLRSLLAGLGRGIGFALGFLLLGALALYLLDWLAELGVPLIGDFIAQLLVYVESVQGAKGLK